jgi:hypothetical protein
MKLAPICSICLAASLVLAQTDSRTVDGASELDRIKSLIQTAIESPAFPGGQFPDSAIEGELEQMKEYQDLRTLLQKARTSPKAWWDSLDHTRDHVAVLLHALEPVSADSYIEFGTAALSRLPEEAASKQTFVIAYLMPTTRKQWIFSSNYQSQKVRTLLTEFRKEFENDQSVVHWIDDVLSGKLATRDQKLREESPTLGAQVIDRPSDVMSSIQSGQSPSVASPAAGRAMNNSANTVAAVRSIGMTELTPWLVWAVMITAATGLLWLMLKQRTK